MKKYLPLVALLIFAGLVYFLITSSSDDAGNDTATRGNVRTQPADANIMPKISPPVSSSTKLTDVTNGEELLGVAFAGDASGEVSVETRDTSYTVKAIFNNLPELSTDYFYEGWLVGDTGFISTGEADIQEDGTYTNTFTTNENITIYTRYVLTLEPRDDDPAPAAHVLEGPLEVIVSDSTSSGGIYQEYDENLLSMAKTGNVVLFFEADWCPTCRALDADIKANLDKIPQDTAILTLDYDTEDALKESYGVTTQHTLIQVGPDGEVIKKWVGSNKLQFVLDQLQ